MTDVGLQDIYVGVMKGVISQLAPQAALIDLTHAIHPQNIRQAAFKLRNAYRYFPAGSVFLVVVDPGVGSVRHPIAVQAGDYTFVAPDNGVLSYTLDSIGGFSQAVAIRVDTPPLSNTFHGRDIFAPAAGKLAAGAALEALGDSVSELVRLPVPILQLEPQRIVGEIVDIDHFGNLVTSIGELQHDDETLALTPVFGESRNTLRFRRVMSQVTLGETVIDGIQRTYADTPVDSLMTLVGSSGFLEISINQGNAAQFLHASIGDPVEIRVGE
jgi:hypothetical protein